MVVPCGELIDLHLYKVEIRIPMPVSSNRHHFFIVKDFKYFLLAFWNMKHVTTFCNQLLWFILYFEAGKIQMSDIWYTCADFFSPKFILFCASEYFACLYSCAPSAEARRVCQMPRRWCHRWLWASHQHDLVLCKKPSIQAPDWRTLHFKVGAGSAAQYSRVLAALPEDPIQFSAHMLDITELPVTPAHSGF